MRAKCAWCQRDLGTREPLDDTRITHGICDDCLKTALGPEAQGPYLRITKHGRTVGIVDHIDRLSINEIEALMRLSADLGRKVEVKEGE